MARIGKIARLPRLIRSELNSRLQDGQEGKQIVLWLNSLPEVKAVLAESFDARPINEQNLSDWRQRGYQEWLARQDLFAQARQLAADRQELQSVAPGHSFTDHLADALAFRFGALLAAQGLELDPPSLRQLRALGRVSQTVVKLRGADQNAARLKIQTERWELARQKILTDNAEDLKRRQRDALAAPIWAALKMGERLEQFGDGPPIQFAVDYLREIESCKAPAHFESKVMVPERVAKLQRDVKQWKKNRPPKRTEVQAAAEMLRDIDIAVGDGSKIKIPPDQPRPKAGRRSRKPANRASIKRPSTRPAHKVHKVHKVHQDDEVHPAVPPQSPSNPAPLAAPNGRDASPRRPRCESGSAISPPAPPTEATPPPTQSPSFPSESPEPINPNQA